MSHSIPKNLISSITVHGEPRSKARPRFTTRNGKVTAYTPKTTVTAERNYAQAWKAKVPANATNKDAAYEVEARFYYAKHQRRDVDNMLKAVLDGLNGIAWVDDTQVLNISGKKIFVKDSAEARSEVDVYDIGAMPWGFKNCEQCDKKFRTYPCTEETRKFCNKKCEQKWREERRQATCTVCGETFDAHSQGGVANRKYCSMECRSKATTKQINCSICGALFTRPQSLVKERNYCSKPCKMEQDRIAHKDRRSKYYPGICLICGAGTTRKEYKRCNPCKHKKLPVPNE